MRGYIESVNLLSSFPMVMGGKTVISDPLPVGEGWHRMNIRCAIITVIGTGAGAVTEGELLFFKNFLLKTDRGEIICNLPGRALYKIGGFKARVAALRKDAYAAASATKFVNFPIFFSDAFVGMMRPEDTVLDTKRYSSLTLEITTGTTADLMTAPGTATITGTIDIEVTRSKGNLPQKGGPVAHISYDYRQPVDASTTTQILLERAQDLANKRIYVHSGTSGTAGVPFSGANSDAVQNVVAIKDQSGFIIKDRIHAMIQEGNQIDYNLESVITGLEVHDFCIDQSIQSALATAGKSLLQYQWTNQGGVGANSIVTAAVESIRSLK